MTSYKERFRSDPESSSGVHEDPPDYRSVMTEAALNFNPGSSLHVRNMYLRLTMLAGIHS